MAEEDKEKFDAEINTKKAELADLDSKIAAAQGFLDRVKMDGATFAAIRNEVAAYRERVIKFKDLDALEERLAKYEERLADYEKRIAQLEEKK